MAGDEAGSLLLLAPRFVLGDKIFLPATSPEKQRGDEEGDEGGATRYTHEGRLKPSVVKEG